MCDPVILDSTTLEEQRIGMKINHFIKTACRCGIVKTILKVTLVVGTIFAAINHEYWRLAKGCTDISGATSVYLVRG
jgi:hypothetical protein